MCLYCSGWIKYCMWVTAGISTFMGGSRSQNVSQCHCATDGTTSKLAGTYPPVKCTSVYFCDFDLSPLCICSCLPGPYMCSDRHQIFFLNRIPSGTRDKVLSVFRNFQLSLFLILSSEVTSSSPWWNDMNIRCKFKEFFVLFRDQWDILCCMSHTATSWLFSVYTHTHTKSDSRVPGGNCSVPPAVSSHMYSQVWLKCVWFWKYENEEELCYLLSSEQEAKQICTKILTWVHTVSFDL